MQTPDSCDLPGGVQWRVEVEGQSRNADRLLGDAEVHQGAVVEVPADLLALEFCPRNGRLRGGAAVHSFVLYRDLHTEFFGEGA